MFLEGLMHMYFQDEDMFWKFIWITTPIFLGGVIWGVCMQMEEDRKGGLYQSPMSKHWAIATVLSLWWYWMMDEWDTFNAPDIMSLALRAGLAALMLNFPLLGGGMTGLALVKAYYWMKQILGHPKIQ